MFETKDRYTVVTQSNGVIMLADENGRIVPGQKECSVFQDMDMARIGTAEITVTIIVNTKPLK